MSNSLYVLLLFCTLVLISYTKQDQAVQTAKDHIKSKAQQTLQLQTRKVKAVTLKYEHIKTYSFGLQNKSSFALKVDHDVQIKAVFNVYWGDTSGYGQSGYHPGEEVSISIFQQGGPLLFSDTCYHTSGFKFLAKKDHNYLIHFGTKGRRKLISMMMENYISHRKGAEKLHTEHVTQHQSITQKTKHKLKSFLSILERNSVMSQQIAKNILLHSKKYKVYQIFEMLLIVLGACTQLFLIKKIIGPSVVV